MNRNEPFTKCKPKREREGKKKKEENKKTKKHIADSVTVSMSGVFSLPLYQQQFYTVVIQT